VLSTQPPVSRHTHAPVGAGAYARHCPERVHDRRADMSEVPWPHEDPGCDHKARSDTQDSGPPRNPQRAPAPHRRVPASSWHSRPKPSSVGAARTVNPASPAPPACGLAGPADRPARHPPPKVQRTAGPHRPDLRRGIFAPRTQGDISTWQEWGHSYLGLTIGKMRFGESKMALQMTIHPPPLQMTIHLSRGGVPRHHGSPIRGDLDRVGCCNSWISRQRQPVRRSDE
jgi:hypothetical protein